MSAPKILFVFSVTLLFTLPASGDIVVGGDRPVTIHVPPSYDPDTPMPLVLQLHGCPSTGAFLESRTGFRPVADSRGFLYAYPNGGNPAGRDACWNAGEAFGDPGRPEVDDVSFLAGLIESAKVELNVDPLRVYVVGRSGGATMVHAMTCELSDTLAAVVCVAASPYTDPSEICSPSGGVHYLRIQGTLDSLVPYAGGAWQGRAFPGAVEAIEQWAEFNDCSLEFDTQVPRMDLDTPAGAETFGARYVSGCSPHGSAELWTVEGGTHNYLATRVGNTTAFAVEIVEWLFRHPKVEVPRAAFSVSAETVESSEVVLFDAAASTTTAGHSIVSYAWDFGDGTVVEVESVNTSHAFGSPGRYDVELIVTDSRNLTMNAGRRITVLFRTGDVSPWTAVDIGEPGFPGGARLEQDCLLISGAEGNILGDTFHFAHQSVTGDFRLTARVDEWSAERTNSRLGVMIRESLEQDARQGTVVIERSRTGFRHRFIRRDTAGGRTTSERHDTYEQPTACLRIERRGTTVSGQFSLDGVNWSEADTVELPDLSDDLYVGVASSYVGSETSFARVCDLTLEALERDSRFLRGECNDDGAVDVSDASCILAWQFLGESPPGCVAAANTNGDKGIDIADAIYLLGSLFLGGLPPVAPFPMCGPGTDTDSILGCETSACE